MPQNSKFQPPVLTPIGPAINIPNKYAFFQIFTPVIVSAEETSSDLHIEDTKQSCSKVFDADSARVDEAVADGDSADENREFDAINNLQQLRNRHVESVRSIQRRMPTYSTSLKGTGQKRSIDDVIEADISQNRQVLTGLEEIIKLTEEYNNTMLKQTRKKWVSSTTQLVE